MENLNLIVAATWQWVVAVVGVVLIVAALILKKRGDGG